MERHKGRKGGRWHLNRRSIRRKQHHSRGSYIETVMRDRSEEHTSELQSHVNLVCRPLLEKKKLESDAAVRAVTAVLLLAQLASDQFAHFDVVPRWPAANGFIAASGAAWTSSCDIVAPPHP